MIQHFHNLVNPDETGTEMGRKKEPGPHLIIKTILLRYGYHHVKDKTSWLLSLTWWSLYWYDDIFILRQPPEGYGHNEPILFQDDWLDKWCKISDNKATQ